MRQQTITVKLAPAKTRAHFVLFAENSPFKPKTVKSKKCYQRTAKHRSQVDH